MRPSSLRAMGCFAVAGLLDCSASSARNYLLELRAARRARRCAGGSKMQCGRVRPQAG